MPELSTEMLAAFGARAQQAERMKHATPAPSRLDREPPPGVRFNQSLVLFTRHGHTHICRETVGRTWWEFCTASGEWRLAGVPPRLSRHLCDAGRSTAQPKGTS